MSKFHTIMTHVKPHLDEILAIWLLRKFGENTFPGVSTAEIVYWGNHGFIRSAAEYERDGILLLGVGGGRFDEHPSSPEEGRKEDECAATLIAKAIDVNEDPALAKILKYVLSNDTKGGSHPFEIATFVKLLHNQFPDQPERVMEWAMTALEAKYHEQVEFHSISEEEWARIATKEEVPGLRDRKYKMATIVSDNPHASKYARSARGGGAEIVILKRSTGNVQIFTTTQSNINLRDLAQTLRVMEQKAKRRMQTTNFAELGIEGKVPGAEEWFYHLGGQMLLNGSLTAKDVPPTQIPLEKIQEAVRISLNPTAFEATHAADCKVGVCTAKDRHCPWYSWGLQRCRQVRFEMKKVQQNGAKLG